eukprot:4809722-Pyramimonas_sp.AAC.1
MGKSFREILIHVYLYTCIPVCISLGFVPVHNYSAEMTGGSDSPAVKWENGLKIEQGLNGHDEP